MNLYSKFMASMKCKKIRRNGEPALTTEYNIPERKYGMQKGETRDVDSDDAKLYVEKGWAEYVFPISKTTGLVAAVLTLLGLLVAIL